MKQVSVELNLDIIADIDEEVIKQGMSEEFQKNYFPFDDEDGFCKWLIETMVWLDIELNEVDGFANISNDKVQIIEKAIFWWTKKVRL